jgi:hypothetical protein
MTSVIKYHAGINSVAEQIIDLLENDVERRAMRKKAYTFSREAVWNVASLLTEGPVSRGYDVTFFCNRGFTDQRQAACC